MSIMERRMLHQIHLECQVLWEATCDHVCREVCANGKRILYCPDHHPSYIDDLLKTFEVVADKDSVATSMPSLPPMFIDQDIVAMPPTKHSPCPRNNQWWPEILKLESEGLVDLKPQGIHPDTNTAFEAYVHVICLLCRDSPGASNGILRTFKYNGHQGNGAPDDAVADDDIEENEQECNNDENEQLASHIELFFSTHHMLTAKKSGNNNRNDCSDSSKCPIVPLESDERKLPC